MRRTLRTLMVGGLVAAGLSLPVAPAQAMCAGYMRAPGEERLGVWGCSECPQTVYGPIDGNLWVVVCVPA